MAGLKVAVTPAGSGVTTLSVICWAAPPVTVVATVEVTDRPGWALPELGLTERPKSLPGAAVQVGSPTAGTFTADHAALTALNSSQLPG